MSKEKVGTYRLSPEVYALLEEIAKKERRKLATLVTILLEDSLRFRSELEPYTSRVGADFLLTAAIDLVKTKFGVDGGASCE